MSFQTNAFTRRHGFQGQESEAKTVLELQWYKCKYISRSPKYSVVLRSGLSVTSIGIPLSTISRSLSLAIVERMVVLVGWAVLSLRLGVTNCSGFRCHERIVAAGDARRYTRR